MIKTSVIVQFFTILFYKIIAHMLYVNIIYY